MSLPSGTVTFLFTDIEGSTRLWEQFPDAMRVALARHNALLHAAIETNNGHVFKTIGDAFCAAFANASDALHATLSAQRMLQAQDWGEIGALRVRIVLHSGGVDERDGDYFGPVLNQTARLLAIGHGQQALLSRSACDLGRDALPAGCSLRDMGSHRLKDLQQPEHVYQLLHPDLPADFPPLRSLQAFANNLPVQTTSFIGREPEMTEIKRHLATTRLLTLSGSGGCGKTRLALQVAADRLEAYPDGVWLVELAPLSDPGLVPQTLAAALGVREEPRRALMETLMDYLKPRALLLLLDNCEHLVQASASLANELLRACPKVNILATSRQMLQVPGERVWRVPSLSAPDPLTLPIQEKNLASVVSEYDAVRLFVERALAQRPSFTLTQKNALALASVCHRLEGIPLAIELAAARARSLAVEEINLRLDNRFRLLTGGDRTTLPRQQTLRALIDWSYDLLNAQEKLLLHRVSVFAGGWTLEAAEQVGVGESPSGAAIEEGELLDLLTSLIDKSLVIADVQESHTRYRLLETIRQYAWDRLQQSGEGETVRRRHGDRFLALAEEAKRKLEGPEMPAWLERLETEYDNLRAALTWCLQEPADAEAGLRLAYALFRFWVAHGHLREGRQWLETALSQSGAPTPLRAQALFALGQLVRNQGDYSAASAYGEQALALFRAFEDVSGIAKAIGHLGLVAKNQNKLELARSLYAESLVLHRQLADKPGLGTVLCNLADLESWLGDFGVARAHLEEALAIDRELGYQRGIAFDLSGLACLDQRQEQYASAQARYQESLEIKRELGDRQGVAYTVGNLGLIALKQGQVALACSLYEEALALHRAVGGQNGIAWTLDKLAYGKQRQGDLVSARALQAESLALFRALGDQMSIACTCLAQAEFVCQTGRTLQAARLLSAAESLREASQSCWSVNDQAGVTTLTKAFRSALGTEAFEAAWAEGRALTLEQAIEYALQGDAE